MSHTSPIDILNTMAESLVGKGKYTSVEEALREIAASAVRNKINHYRRRIRKFERKYEIDFDTFTARLKGRATPAEEDDWIEWRSAQNMLADWQKTHRDLGSNGSHR